MNEIMVISGGEDPKDHKFIRTKVVTMLRLGDEKDDDDDDEMKMQQ